MGVSLKKIEKWAQKKKVSKLIKALSIDSLDVRLAIIKVLGPTKDESAMYTLINYLKDPNASIRASAVEALGVMANGRSLEFVKQMWNSETDENVRAKAKIAINLIKENAVKAEKQ